MKELAIGFLGYAVVGIAFCIFLARRDKLSGGLPPWICLSPDPIGLLGLAFLSVFWPPIAFIMIVEQSFVIGESESAENLPNKLKIPIGARGTATARMKPSGKIKVGSNTFGATSVSGFIEAGDPVEVVGRELNEYRIKKVDPGEDAKH